MSFSKPPAILKQGLAELENARIHLEYSYQRVQAFPASLKGVTEAELETAEAFTGRFARALDLLVNKVLRSLDRVELRPQGTLLDVINRAEQRGFLANVQDLREMKDVRNIIAHDYAGSHAAEIFTYCREAKPRLDDICDKVQAYAAPLTTNGD